MKKSIWMRAMSVLLSLALLAGVFPFSAMAAAPLAQDQLVGTVVDPSTADAWEHMMGTEGDGNRYAGRVWVDKSVYRNGDTALLGGGKSFRVNLEEDEKFQVVFSALGSTMSSKSTVTSTGPMDVVLILDNSVSMNTTSAGTTRMQKVIEAANRLLADLLENNDVRLGIAAYSEDASTVLPFGAYTDGVVLKVNSYTGSGSSNGVITAYNSSNQVINRSYKSNGYANYTNTQAGFDLGMEMLSGAANTQNRKPVVILLTDGAANTAVDTLFDNDRTGTVRQVYYSNNIDPMIALSTLLGASYNKASVEDHYGVAPMVYGVGVDLSSTDGSNAIIDPKNNFNSANSNQNIRSAYDTYLNTWAAGKDVVQTSGSGNGFGWGGSGGYTFRFGHEYPLGSSVTDADIKANIGYVDTYYPVNGAGLQDVFEQIYEELSSGAFNPISSTVVTEGSTGVKHTPLIFVDYIGQHMELKDVQAISLFGSTYNVSYKNGAYAVDLATGTNPTTKEAWNTADDIRITVIEQTDGTQKLEIRINQEILPILMEKVESETLGAQTNATITEIRQEPLRIFYTVGLDPEILLPGGRVDASKLQGYSYLNEAEGTVDFYAGGFGQENPADSLGVVLKGDSHVGFKPSYENRYYYHQAHQSIFTGIVDDATGKPVTIPENNQYGLLWDGNKYSLIRMTYEEYQQKKDDDRVYTYVTYFRPTPSSVDSADTAEEVIYLIYADWKYMKESVGFVNGKTGEYLYDGKAIPEEQVASVVAAYLAENPDAEIFAVLGIGSLRTSRLHNMTANKSQNLTGTATESYAPEYLHGLASQHNGNDVVVWLGNNGRLTVEVETGIALTKNVTESIGNADDLYSLTVTVPSGVSASPVVWSAEGEDLTASRSVYVGNVLTVSVKAGETVYVGGIPAGTTCTVGETIPAGAEYYVADQSLSVTVPTVSQALNGTAQYAPVFVTNAPYKYGNLFITKEVESEHSLPASVLNESFTVKVELGTALAGKSFTVLDSAYSAPYEVTVAADGVLSFDLKEAQTVEILRLPAGSAVTVTEEDPGSHYRVSYRSRNLSGTAADADGNVVIPETGSATVVIINEYSPAPVSVVLDVVGEKNFTAPALHPGGAFHFEVQRYDGTGWVSVAGKTASVPYAAGEDGTKTFLIENVLEGVSFDRVGEYAYRVLEIKGNVENVTYDRTLYTFDVTVTDNGGQLVATVTDRNDAVITDGSYEVVFHNSYNTAPVSVDITKNVINLSGDTTVPKHGFAFEALRTDASWQPLTGALASTLTVYSDAAGEARFSATYDAAGDYYYVLREVNANAPSWSYSQAEYRIKIRVTADLGGKLTAILSVESAGTLASGEGASVNAGDATKATVSFVNSYDPEDVSVDPDLVVRKELTGKTLEEGAFTFYVYADGGSTPLLEGKNGRNGDAHLVDFEGELHFTQAGKYAFDVKEAIPDGAVYDAHTQRYVLHGMSYDPTVYDLVVEVRNDLATGKLVASYYFEDAVEQTVTFRNSYSTTPTAYTFAGTKILHGRAMRAGEFTFELYAADGTTLLQSVTNKADGSFTFASIPYTEAGQTTYVVKEKAQNAGGVTYDSTEYTVTVSVVDTLGVLSASADVANTEILFENSYAAAPAEWEIRVHKTLKGAQNDSPADGDFTFRLYRTDLSFDVASASSVEVASATNQNAQATFEVSLDAPGTYYFAVLEDREVNPKDDVVYDRSLYRYVVQVSDPGNGQLMVAVSDLVNKTEVVSAPSVGVDADFVNALKDEVAEKEVALSSNTTVQIDGQKVEAGDVLTYYLTYTNFHGVDVVADIRDSIPKYTSYVEGSATHGGTFAGDRLNWVLNVPRGQSVTVSFAVKVDQTQVIVANVATMLDGVNTYTTNEVFNHTVDKLLVKDVFSSAEPEISIDGNEVEEGDELVYEIRFWNPTGETVDLVIRDEIPANASYVEGSADLGGVYADGAITWTLQNVEPWSDVTVSFAVKVNAVSHEAEIRNKATASDGVNAFESNVVKNSVKPPVTSAPESSAPATTAPATTAPATTAPATTAPATTAPATTAPATTAPATTAAPTTAAPTTAPATTAPATTAPATTAPATTAAPTTAAPTTAAPTTAPATTVPPTSASPVTGDGGDFHFGFLLALSGGGLAVSLLSVKKKKESEE